MNQFERVSQAIMAMKQIDGRNAKLDWLRYHQHETGFKEILQFIFNPYIRTGIAAAKLKKYTPLTNLDAIPISWQDIINHFTAHQTGSGADVAMAMAFIRQQRIECAKDLAIAMVTKTLKIGVTETSLNSIYGDDFIPKIGIMRGQHYKDNIGKVQFPLIAPKTLDGARRILVKENGTVTMYTRSGHLDEGLVDIESEAVALPDNSVYDGELLAIGTFNNSIELRQATNAIANSKGIRHGLTYNVFDMIALQDFKSGKSSHNAMVRKTLLAGLFEDKSLINLHHKDACLKYFDMFSLGREFTFIKPVPILGLIQSDAEVFERAKPIWDRGFEGLMLNVPNGHYVVSNSPSRDLLKVKATEEFKLMVTGVYEGKGEIAGMLGGVYLDYKGYQVGCGSGFNHPQRKRYWANPELIIGKLVEGDSFGESKNQQGGISLNCPIFKRISGIVE